MLTMGAPVVAGLKTSLLKDVHLMIEEPLSKIESFVAAGADIITVHVESTRHAHRVLQALGKMTNANDASTRHRAWRGAESRHAAGSRSIPLLDELEMVVMLAVNPGWGGQKFIRFDLGARQTGSDRRSATRRPDLRGRRHHAGERCGCSAPMGADIIVTGSAVFDGNSPVENAQYMVGRTPMKSLWNDRRRPDSSAILAQRVYTSRLLGQDPSLVLHGGGNTSVKICETNLFGEEEEMLYIKGRGCNLETIERRRASRRAG